MSIADSTEAIKLEPNNPAAYLLRGRAHFFNAGSEGDFDDLKELNLGLQDFNKAVSLGVKLGFWPLLYRSNIYYRLNRLDESISDLSQAINQQPDDYFPRAERGKGYFKKRNFDSAISDFSQAIKLKPQDRWLYISRGEAFYQKGDIVSAIRDFEESARIDPNFIRANYFLAGALFDAGRYDESLTKWQKVLELSSGQGRMLAGKAITLAALGKKEEALKTFEEAVERDRRFWDCQEQFKGDYDYFWFKSGCRAIAPLAESSSSQTIKSTLEELRRRRPK